MKGFLLLVVGIILGAVGTFFVTSGVMTGIGAGAGIMTGLKAGTCLTAEAAKERGYVSGEQVDDLLQAAIQQITSTGAEQSPDVLLSDAECTKVVEDLKAAVSKEP